MKDHRSDRPLVAKALLQLGVCYEKLGDAGARKAYEQLVREFADQRESAASARARLAAMSKAELAARPAGPRARQVWGYTDGPDTSGTVSADGRYVSFTDWNSGNLALRDLTTGVNRRITKDGWLAPSSGHAEGSAISPDGRRIAYSWVFADGSVELRVIDVSGGEPRVRYRNADMSYLVPYEWSPDGRSILLVLTRQDRTNQVAILPADEGPVRVLKTFDWRSPWRAAYSPDGQYVVYDLPASGDAPERDLFVLAVDGSREAALVTHAAHDFLLGWAPGTDRVLFVSDRTGTPAAWAIRVSDGKPAGDTVLVKPNIGHVLAMNFSRKGDYYYALSTGLREVHLTEWDPAAGKVTPLAPLKGRFEEGKGAAVWSPDGTEIAYLLQSPLVRGGEGANTLAIRTMATGQVRTVPLNLTYALRVRWLPDRRAVIIQGTDLKGRRGIFRIPLTGGEMEPIAIGRIPRFDVARDGRTVFYERETAIVRRDLQTGEERDVHALPAYSGMALSPDGQWLALKVNRPGDDNRPSIQILPAAGGEPRTIHTLPDADTSTWRQLAWSPDGRTVLFTNHHTELWQIPAAGGAPQKLVGNLSMIGEISIHPDGRRIALSAGNAKYEIWAMENLLPGPSGSSSTSARPRGAARR